MFNFNRKYYSKTSVADPCVLNETVDVPSLQIDRELAILYTCSRALRTSTIRNLSLSFITKILTASSYSILRRSGLPRVKQLPATIHVAVKQHCDLFSLDCQHKTVIKGSYWSSGSTFDSIPVIIARQGSNPEVDNKNL